MNEDSGNGDIIQKNVLLFTHFAAVPEEEFSGSSTF